MSHADVISLLPEILLTAGGIVILLLEAVSPRFRPSFTPLAVLTTLFAAWGAWHAWTLAGPEGSTTWNGMLETSRMTLAFSLVSLLVTVLCLLASQGYLVREGILAGEYHALLLWCATGVLLMIRATDLLSIFLALELLSLCLYCLAAFHRRVAVGSEAAIKYFLMGAFVSAFLLFGVALIYGAMGTINLREIGIILSFTESISVFGTLGFLLVLAAFGFKLSLVPFHAWSPDTYQGAPSPFVAFLSVAPKVASAFVVYRLLDAVVSVDKAAYSAKWGGVVAILAVSSMVVGNLLALVQRDIKRMLAYSGIAHMGYLLLALVVVDRASLAPVLVYLLAYALMNAGAFTVVTLLYDQPGEQHLISSLAGLGYRYPMLGACLAVCMLSLGGIPPTAGFLGKYVVFLNAVGDGRVGLAIVGVLASLVGVFYYLRVVYYLYMKSEVQEPARLRLDAWGRTAALLAALGILVLGIWPTGLLQWLTSSPPIP